MEEIRLCDRATVAILEQHTASASIPQGRSDWFARSYPYGAGIRGPDRGKVAFARPWGSGEQQGAPWPAGPRLNGGDGGFVRSGDEEVVPVEAGRTREIEHQLAGHDAG